MSQYPHLHESLKDVMILDKYNRIKHVDEALWIAYPKAVKLIELLNEYKDRPKTTRTQSLLIIGDSHMGKTKIMEEFLKEHPTVTYKDEEGLERIRKPVILATAGSTTHEKDLYIAILRALKTSFRPTESKVKLKYQAISLMESYGVRILIIDEIHDLIDTTMIKQRNIMNEIKYLTNELKLPIVAVGIEKARPIINYDPQLSSRFDIVNLPKWENDKNFKGILKVFEKKFPLKKPSHLSGEGKSKLLYRICRGNLGDLHRLLKACTKYAIESNEEEITIDIIHKHSAHKNSPIEISI